VTNLSLQLFVLAARENVPLFLLKSFGLIFLFESISS